MSWASTTAAREPAQDLVGHGGDGGSQVEPVGVGVPAGEPEPLEQFQGPDDGRSSPAGAAGADAQLGAEVGDVDVDAVGLAAQEQVESPGGEDGGGPEDRCPDELDVGVLEVEPVVQGGVGPGDDT